MTSKPKTKEGQVQIIGLKGLYGVDATATPVTGRPLKTPKGPCSSCPRILRFLNATVNRTVARSPLNGRWRDRA